MSNNTKKNKEKHVFESVLTMFILSILLVVGPVSSTGAQIETSQVEVIEGEEFVFNVALDSALDDRVESEEFEFEILGNNGYKNKCKYSNNTYQCDKKNTKIVKKKIVEKYDEDGYGYKTVKKKYKVDWNVPKNGEEKYCVVTKVYHKGDKIKTNKKCFTVKK